jgi:UDP-N-acetylglucosamine--N-acetylmuramyl-(pentapeptide) pyrophosphoryl-undecaprenol N-acetylglucosamine transferase
MDTMHYMMGKPKRKGAFMKKIILTGGGTAGHVVPHLALLPKLKEKGFEIHYIGGKTGIERELVKNQGIPYHGISAGKLRRYADIKNITDPFRVLKGFGEAFRLIRIIKPDIVFSKGGFVTVPVVIAARLCGARTVIHESDYSPGLANRLVMPFTHQICVSFPETLTQIPARKAVLTGTPIRPTLFNGDKDAGRMICKFSDDGKPVVLFTGGSLGAAAINDNLRKLLPGLCERYRIIHLCGKGNLSGLTVPGYAEFEFVGRELPHLFSLADMAVSRAGANTIFELLALRLPHLLIPLTLEASRGDQLRNASSFEKQGFSKVLQEPRMKPESLSAAIDALYLDRQKYRDRMAAHKLSDGVAAVLSVIDD